MPCWKCNEFRVKLFPLVSIEHKTTRGLRTTIKSNCVLADLVIKLYRLWEREIEKIDWEPKMASIGVMVSGESLSNQIPWGPKDCF